MPRPTGFRLLLIAALLATSACGDDNENLTPTTPTNPTTVTETFSGTLTVNGAVTHPFATQLSGAVTATLTSVAPDNTKTMGLSLGTWNGAVCQIVLANDQARQGTVVTGNVTSTLGSLCVRIYDVGQLTEAATYEIQVVHP
jgi:hypothetical protein